MFVQILQDGDVDIANETNFVNVNFTDFNRYTNTDAG